MKNTIIESRLPKPSTLKRSTLGHFLEILLMDTFKRQLSRFRSEPPPESVLAFSTITTMLAQIKQARTFSNNPKSSKSRKALRALNALATLLVRDKEVVAVVGNQASGQFEVIACATASVPNDIDGGSWKWIITPNVRKDTGDALTPSSDVPAITDPTKPKFDLPLKEYIINNPWVLSNNSTLADISKMI